MTKGLRYQTNFKSVTIRWESIRTSEISIDEDYKKNHLEASGTK